MQNTIKTFFLCVILVVVACAASVPSLAVVFPFYDGEVAKIGNSWENVQPCARIPHRPDLVLLYSKSRNDVPLSVQVTASSLQAKYGHCFADVVVRYLNLSEKQDVHPSGVSIAVFESIIHTRRTLGKNYDWMFILETDVIPVRENWVSKLNSLSAVYPDCWIAGSLYHGTEWDKTSNPLWWKNHFMNWGMHINGAALYNLHSKEFKDFTKIVASEEPPDSVWKPYDTSFRKVYTRHTCQDPEFVQNPDPARFAECLGNLRKWAHRFCYTRCIMNFGSSEVQSLPMETFLVHSASDDLSRSKATLQHLKAQGKQQHKRLKPLNILVGSAFPKSALLLYHCVRLLLEMSNYQGRIFYSVNSTSLHRNTRSKSTLVLSSSLSGLVSNTSTLIFTSHRDLRGVWESLEAGGKHMSMRILSDLVGLHDSFQKVASYSVAHETLGREPTSAVREVIDILSTRVGVKFDRMNNNMVISFVENLMRLPCAQEVLRSNRYDSVSPRIQIGILVRFRNYYARHGYEVSAITTLLEPEVKKKCASLRPGPRRSFCGELISV